jgi:hypothetical protein
LLVDASRELRLEFVRLVYGLSGVQAARVSSSVMVRPGTESVHFAVPDSSHGDQRVLQVFFVPMTSPTPEQFVQLRHLAVLASGLPDIDVLREADSAAISRPSRSLRSAFDGAR